MRPLIPLLLLAACHAPKAPPIPAEAPTGAARELPTLRFEAEANVPDLQDLRLNSQIVVTPQGALVFESRDALVLRVRHRDGRTLAFGHQGQGPGEVASPRFLYATDSTLVYRDLAQERIVRFGLDGTPRSSERVRLPYVNASAPIRDEEQVLFAWGQAERNRRVLRVDTRTGGVAAIDMATDSFARHWTYSGREHGEPLPPLPGTWYGGFLLADREAYAVAFYTWAGERVGLYQQPGDSLNLPSQAQVDALVADLARAGRHLSPVQRADLLKKPQPWFTSSPRQDAEGRTWFLIDRGGRPEFDVFLGPNFLGSLAMSCLKPGLNWDLAGRWLAIICLPSDPDSEMDAMVRLYEIQ